MRISSLFFKRSLRPSARQTASKCRQLSPLTVATFDRNARPSRRTIPYGELSPTQVVFFQGVEKSLRDSPVAPELAKDLHSSLASITRTHMQEASMLCCGKFRALILISGFLASTTAYAQSPMDEIGPLPAALSAEQLQLLAQLTPVAVPEPPQPRARRRLPRPVLPLTPDEVSYREAVQRLGVNTHQFVHCDLASSKVRTGVITEIRDDGFVLKDGIIIG
jgi:hypothetical protein